MKRIKYPLTVKLSVLLILIVLTLINCYWWVVTSSIIVYFSNQTQSNFHVFAKDGRRINQGETSILPVVGLNEGKDKSARTVPICRDDGCIINITVVGTEFPERKEGEEQFKDSVVVEEPERNVFTAYTITGVTTVNITEAACSDGIDNDNDGDADNNDSDCMTQ